MMTDRLIGMEETCERLFKKCKKAIKGNKKNVLRVAFKMLLAMVYMDDEEKTAFGETFKEDPLLEKMACKFIQDCDAMQDFMTKSVRDSEGRPKKLKDSMIFIYYVLATLSQEYSDIIEDLLKDTKRWKKTYPHPRPEIH